MVISVNTSDHSQAERLSRAKGYPYPIPDTSYIVDASGWRLLPENCLSSYFSGRVPVLALGSNRSPDQLMRKYSSKFISPILVTLGWLYDFDVVYSAHITSYGSVPATLQYAPGVKVAVSITWLNPLQLVRMHETESVGISYDFGRLSNVRVVLQRGELLTEAFVYISRLGNLVQDGDPLAMREAAAMGRRWPALGQEGILNFICEKLSPNQNLDSFVFAHLNSAETRHARTALLSQSASPFAYSGFEIIAG
jgi:hypothetical protein